MNWSRALAALLGLALAGAFVGNSVSDDPSVEHSISIAADLTSNAGVELTVSIEPFDSEEPLQASAQVTIGHVVRSVKPHSAAAALRSTHPEAGLRPPTFRA